MIHASVGSVMVTFPESVGAPPGMLSMIALLFALFCAVSLNFVGALDQTTDMAVGILLVWGIAVFFLPRPTLTGWRLLVAAALVRLTLLPIDAGEFSNYSTLLAHASILWDGGNPYSGASPSSYSPLKLWLFAPFADLQPWIPRLATVGMDVLLVSILVRFLSSRSRRMDIAWIYALHPLGAVESAVHGNLDALMLGCAVGATLAWDAKKSGQGWASLGSLVNASLCAPSRLIRRRRQRRSRSRRWCAAH